MTKHIDLDALQALTEKATPGERAITSYGDIVVSDRRIASVQNGGMVNIADANLIAACDPQTILALISRIRDLESRADAIKSAEPVAATDGNKLWWLPGHPKFVPSKPVALYVAPAAQQLSDEQIEDAIESARDCLVAGFGYRYNEQRLHEALRDMINSQLEGK